MSTARQLVYELSEEEEAFIVLDDGDLLYVSCEAEQAKVWFAGYMKASDSASAYLYKVSLLNIGES